MSIIAIRGRMYDRPTGHDGETAPDSEFSACVGAPFDYDAPVVTDIRKTGDGRGPAGAYDRLTVYAGETLLFECPAAMALITYGPAR